MDGRGRSLHIDGGQRSGKSRFLTIAIASALTTLLLSLFLSTALGQDNLLSNGGFEDGTSSWNTSYGATFVTITEPVSSGLWAASLYRGGTTGEIWIYQDVPVEPSATYTLTGWALKNDSHFDPVCLRIEWPGSTALPSDDCLYGDNDYYRPITIGPTLPPSDASVARIKAVADIFAANPPGPVYFDELSFTSSLERTGYLPLLLKNYPR
jgi:hypothetical protein